MKILVSFSGGKDSQACLIKAVKDYGVENTIAVFCDTGWEHPLTYSHVNSICNQLNVRLTILKSKYNFISLAKKKGRFPSTKARFCTEELKVKPMIDYVLSLDESCIIIQGIRSKESAARAEMEAECMYFNNYFTPLKNGKTYSYRRRDVNEWCKRYDASVLRPIKDWTAQQVIDYILYNDQLPNPLYLKGFSRVGCFPCIMCRHQEIKLISKYDKGMTERLIMAEKEVGRSFFPPNYIPKRFCKQDWPTTQEVIAYVSDESVDMFEPEEGYNCMSLYHGLCE